jgi:hypothetical protein
MRGDLHVVGSDLTPEAADTLQRAHVIVVDVEASEAESLGLHKLMDQSAALKLCLAAEWQPADRYRRAAPGQLAGELHRSLLHQAAGRAKTRAA